MHQPTTSPKPVPLWWQKAFPAAHAELSRLASHYPKNWHEIVLIQWQDPSQVSPAIRQLKARLGVRALAESASYEPGDGVTIVTHGSRGPGTVRRIEQGARVVVTPDYYARLKHTERTLFLPVADASSLTFTKRGDGMYRLFGSKTTFLEYGRSFA